MQGIDEEKELKRAIEHGQKHLAEHYSSLKSEGEKEEFLRQLSALDYEQALTLFEQVYIASKKEGLTKPLHFEPVGNVSTLAENAQHSVQYQTLAEESIARGEVGVCLMSGGQGTRLGFDHPKGMFDLGLKSGLTLFAFFAHRLLCLSHLICKSKGLPPRCLVRWYLMTSEMNHQEIVDYFAKNEYFGYDPKAIVFFPQGGLPALSYSNQILIEEPGRLSLAPGGNGAIYQEMRQKGVIADMRKHSVKYIYLGPVDNVLLKLADPLSLGYLLHHNFDIVSHFLKKRSPDEKVGLHVKVDGKVKVCEYTELPEECKNRTDEEGKLIFNHGARATMVVTCDFIDKITADKATMENINKKFHLAEKKIKHLDLATGQIVKPTINNGVKFELFYFDVFEETDRIGLFETAREDEFAPLKNAEGEDSPHSARVYLAKMHRKWLEKTGVEFIGEGDVEIAPSVSYNGEGLAEHIIKQFGSLKVPLPCFIH